MKRVTIYMPHKLYEELLKMKKDGYINSISEFLRTITTLYVKYGGQQRVIYKEREITVENYTLPSYKPKQYKQAVFGSLQKEVTKQLLEAFKKLKKTDSSKSNPQSGEPQQANQPTR